VADAVEVPVVAAGGIGDGRGIAAAMALGADGAQLGTRFIATEECPAHENYKRLIVDAPDTGTRIIGRQLDMLRVLKTGFAETVAAAEATGADQAQLLSIIGNEFNRNQIGSLSGNLAEGAFQAGQSSGLVRNIQPVAALIEQLIDEYERARNSLAPWH
jgi:enoyl-[acyl-carrier protein] reductase II